ncbi:MAG TPA: hypothetical protein PKA77_17110 [Chitinophagaceae bacterium]|jgi:hypothetical protein|nr:hypothetical protein [Chitinophagaceae bacterium]
MKKNKPKYLTFPVAILKDSLIDVSNCVNNAMNYCLYDYYQRETGSKDDLIDRAGKFYGITWGNKKTAFDSGKIIYESLPARSPKTSINKDMIFDFYKNEKTEFEIVVFLAFAAIRSILQKQPYTKITNEYLIGRMSGNSAKGEPVNPLLTKYTSRYQLDKIKSELQLNWGLNLYGNHTRGFYVSFVLTYDELIMQAELKRKRYKEKQLRSMKSEALSRVKSKILAAAP